MINVFVPLMRKTLHDAGQLSTDSGVEEMENTFLIGFNGRLFEVGIDFSVDEHIEGYCAIGRGDEFALGALHVLQGENKSAKEKINCALEAAKYFNSSVGGDFVIESVTKNDPIEQVVDDIVEKANKMMAED